MTSSWSTCDAAATLAEGTSHASPSLCMASTSRRTHCVRLAERFSPRATTLLRRKKIWRRTLDNNPGGQAAVPPPRVGTRWTDPDLLSIPTVVRDEDDGRKAYKVWRAESRCSYLHTHKESDVQMFNLVPQLNLDGQLNWGMSFVTLMGTQVGVLQSIPLHLCPLINVCAPRRTSALKADSRAICTCMQLPRRHY